MNNILDKFAFPQIRDSQAKLLKNIEEAYKSTNIVIVEAPTGIGKSGVIMTAGLYYGTSYIVTASKLLQEQYLRDFPYVKQIVGRSNFDCIDPMDQEMLQNKIANMRGQQKLSQFAKVKMEEQIANMLAKKKTCAEGDCIMGQNYICSVKPGPENYKTENRGTPQELIQISNTKYKLTRNPQFGYSELEPDGHVETWCHYYNQKYKGLAAGHTAINYKYYFSLFNSNKDDFDYRDLIAFDEAHSIENEVIDFIGISLSRKHFEKMARDILEDDEVALRAGIKVQDTYFPTKNVEELETWTAYLKKTYLWLTAAYKVLRDRYKGTDEESIADLTNLKRQADKISYLLDLINQDGEGWVVDVRFEKVDATLIQDVKISPLEIGKFVRPMFDVAEKKMFVSATLFDKEVFCKMIGVSPDEASFIRVHESPFPVQNRPIKAYNIGEMSYNTMQGLLPTIASTIDSIMEDYNKVKGIIHVTSYTQADYIQKNVSRENRQRLLVTGGGISQAEILRKHEVSDNSVLISPSMHQGVDLKDDLSRFQIIVKVPYPDLSDKRTLKKMKQDGNWYRWQTMLRIVQTYGRSVRSETDQAVTFILDSNFKKFQNSRMMPMWVRQAITPI